MNYLDTIIHQDYKKISRKIEKFTSGYVSKSSAKGLVIGLSGGLDSSVVLQLGVNSLGPSKVLGLLMPSDTTPKDDVKHAAKLAKSLNVRYKIIDINPIIAKYEEQLPTDKLARGNLMARIRMNVLYHYAGTRNLLVAGTSDKSELYIGYTTKWGDSAADILPIAEMYKVQVRALARFLDIPSEIVEKKSSPRLWPNHTAEKEIGMDYETIDQILYLIVDQKVKNTKQVAKKLRIPIKQVEKIKKMLQASHHKRSLGATAPTS